MFVTLYLLILPFRTYEESSLKSLCAMWEMKLEN